MNYQEILNQIKPELDETFSNFQQVLREIRIGRLASSLIEEIKVECFGSIMPLKQLGLVSVSDREIVVQLWDNSYAEAVVKAIDQRKMGLSIRPEGKTIYLYSPPLTEESRKNLLRVLQTEKEKIYQELRRSRDNLWKKIQESERAGQISEDDKYRAKDKMEEMFKDYKEKLDRAVEAKQKEIES